jgi:gluconolactonase
MSWFPPPRDIPTEVFASLPAAFREPRVTDWSRANKGGALIDSFLEGPVVEPDGSLCVVDIPNGRIFRISPSGTWTLLAQYDGWPNGMKRQAGGGLLIADYRRGLLQLDPSSGDLEPLLETLRSESFKGVNDLTFGPAGEIYFTDQGQTGMQDPSGRVYRLNGDGKLDCLLSNCPSPNGLVLNKAATHLYVAMTRACQVWRVPVSRDSGVSKAQIFVQLPGGVSGPDGLAIDEDDNLAICDPGHGCVWLVDAFGVPRHRVLSCAGRTVTNLAYGGEDRRTLFITESGGGQILAARMPVPGFPVRAQET